MNVNSPPMSAEEWHRNKVRISLITLRKKYCCNNSEVKFCRMDQLGVTPRRKVNYIKTECV